MLTIVANIYAKPDHAALVKSELEKLIPLTLKEAGCVQYDLHTNNDNPAHFMFYEIWESRELWQEHMKAPHLAAYLESTEGVIEDFQIAEMSRVG